MEVGGDWQNFGSQSNSKHLLDIMQFSSIKEESEWNEGSALS